jgi:hypothetical protein
LREAGIQRRDFPQVALGAAEDQREAVIVGGPRECGQARIAQQVRKARDTIGPEHAHRGHIE